MLIYNTTYHLEEEVENNFLIWLNEVYIPKVRENELFKEIRLCRILSHIQEGNVSYTLQWTVEKSADLHVWHLNSGVELNSQITAIFKDKVLGIPTLMEVIE